MRYLFLSALAILVASATAVLGQLSYNCSGNLNPTERAICGNADLARLDLQMAQAYRSIRASLDVNRRQAFRNRQVQWRRDRDACGVSSGCIRANYVARLYEFGVLSQQSSNLSGPAPAPDGSTKVLPDGTMERRTADGMLIRRLPNGEFERYLPDGTKLPRALYKQVQVSTLPPLPPQLESWGSALEQSLYTVLDNILSDDELTAYAATEIGKQDYDLIDWRLRSVLFLTQNP